jgi:hypothetical protein
MRITRSLLCVWSAIVCLLLCSTCVSFAQTETATISGHITDSTGATIRGASVELKNTQQGVSLTATTNNVGIYVFPSVTPGKYALTVRKEGFKQVDLVGVIANVQGQIEQNFRLDIGSVSESVTVSADTNNINTTDASVGTVIDRQFVENIPMNGRSFQTLVLLSPGVVTNNPNVGGADSGEYSVNGQRTDANGFYVDGASASNTVSAASTGGNSAMLPSTTALGTTQAMLQLDAMEEFRISTSSYSAEFGNHPGGQISFRSRSGTNQYHGTAFDYLRNSAFDSNNWFNTYSTTPTPTPAERQNDFGGTFGGPVTVPHLYSGRDHTFYFFSYEGLRLDTPSAANIYDVPTNGTFITNNTYYSNPADAEWANLRKYAPAGTQALLNSFPLPNCDIAIDPQCVDYGEGGSPYISSQQNTGIIDALSARVDYQAKPWMHLFARYADTVSNVISYGSSGGPYEDNNQSRTRIFLLGIDSAIGSKISNELRLQYSPTSATVVGVPYQVGGAQPYSFFTAQGINSGETYLRLYLPNEISQYTQTYGRFQFQPNVTEALTWTHGKNLFKFGATWLQTTAYYDRGIYSRGPLVDYHFTSAAQVLSGVPGTQQVNEFDRQDPTYKNWGVYAQDEWKVLDRLTLSLGLRWELAPPPSISGTPSYTYTGSINNPSSLQLSALGAPLFTTKWTDFAPRFGAAYVLRNGHGHETVLRAGGGMFYDSIEVVNFFGNGDALGSQSIYTYKTQFPLQASQLDQPVIKPVAPYSFIDYPANNIVPPYTLQWNASVEQAIGLQQSVTLGYIASLGRKLNTYQDYSVSSLNQEFGTFDIYVNGPGSSYNALQLKYQRQMAHGFQTLAAYTWAHSIDSSSSSTSSSVFPLERGNSDHDIRNNFTAAAVYNLPSNYNNIYVKALLAHWNADLWLIARSAFPYEPQGANVTDPVTGDVIFGELNWNGKNPYIHEQGIPGGRQINPADFSITSTPLGVGTLPRNMLRAFGEAQANVSIARTFPIYDRLNLQFRAEAFNLLNHPVFGAVSLTCGTTTLGATCTNTIMGQATNTLNTGLGNLNSLYQQGGPRSLEFMLKLQF